MSVPDFGLAGLRWDLRDELGGSCVECGIESDTKLCADCESRVADCAFCVSRCLAEPGECWR